MWLRALLVGMLMALVGRLMTRIARSLSMDASPEGDGARRRATGSSGTPQRMVRDRICNTFLPEDLALQVNHLGETHYFCSESCRSRFLAADSAPSPSRG